MNELSTTEWQIILTALEEAHYARFQYWVDDEGNQVNPEYIDNLFEKLETLYTQRTN